MNTSRTNGHGNPVEVRPLGTGFLIREDTERSYTVADLDDLYRIPALDPAGYGYYQQVLRLAAPPATTAETEAPTVGAEPVDVSGLIIDADDDTEPLDWPGEWAPGEQGRIWLATGQGEYTLLAGLPGHGKSHLAQELAAREREAGGHPLAIVPEAANSWRKRNRQYPTEARCHILPGVPDMAVLRAALEHRADAGKPWPTMLIVDPATLVVAEWADSRREAATYDYPTVARAVANLEAAVESPDGQRPKLVWCVHTPETEAGGRNRRAVGGYSQAAGVAYLLPAVGKVTVLKRPRDCPEDPPDQPMLYTRQDGRIRFAGLGTGKGEHRGKRDRNTDRRRIREVIVQAGDMGATQRQVIQLLPGVGRVTAASVLGDLVDAGEAETYEGPGVNGKPITRYRTTGRPVETQAFRLPDEPPF